MVHRIFPKAAFFLIHLAADRLTMHVRTRHLLVPLIQGFT